MWRRLKPFSSRWVAKLWRNECIETFFNAAIGNNSLHGILYTTPVHMGFFASIAATHGIMVSNITFLKMPNPMFGIFPLFPDKKPFKFFDTYYKLHQVFKYIIIMPTKNI